MNPLFDPNLGITLLVGGLVLALAALFLPGTGLIEIGALAALVLAGVVLMNLPFNAWALVLMAAAVVPLVLAVRGKRSLLPLAAAWVLLLAGSLFLFRPGGGREAVSPLVAVLVSLSATGFTWLVARKGTQTLGLRKMHDLETLVGMIGTARTDLRPEGSVYVGGEAWSARAAGGSIEAGSAVRVIRRDGLVLDVEKVADMTGQS